MRPALLITIDTESDDLWARRPELSFENIRQLPRLHEFFERHGVRPCYLVTYPVARSEIGRRVLAPIARRGTAEIGAHMHVWTTPPLRPVTPNDDFYCPLATEIPPELHREKLASVTRAVADLTGASPRSYRAGRYGLDAAGLRLLEEQGYQTDTSVTPMLSWEEPPKYGGRRLVDFRSAPLEPYFPSREDVTRPGDSTLLEVPISYFLTRPMGSGAARRLARLPRNHPLLRVLRAGRVVSHAWLRPGRNVSAAKLIGVARAILAAGVPVLNVMFHSSEMAAGTSPHTRTEAQVEESYAQLGELLRAALGEMNAQPMTLSEFRAAWCAEHGAPAAVASHVRA
jgi:hypothetical protein